MARFKILRCCSCGAQRNFSLHNYTGLTMVVSLDGYQGWVYGVDGGIGGTALFLHPEQQEILDIRLKPKPPSRR